DARDLELRRPARARRRHHPALHRHRQGHQDGRRPSRRDAEARGHRLAEEDVPERAGDDHAAHRRPAPRAREVPVRRPHGHPRHDALIKPMPGDDMAPSLATSWKESPDGLTYEFKLREGLKFHNGDPFTAEDVKFSFHRYRGTAAKLLHERVKAVEILDPTRVRFVLHAPWPDFLTFYATPATGAAWIVPKKYLEKVGEDGFKRQPVGLGPYRFVRMTPGVEVVFEANEQYWRKK